MNSVSPAERFPALNPQSAGAERSDRGVAPLDPEIYREMRFCPICECEEEFVEVFTFCCGRVGVCLGCGDEKVLPFSRTNGERV